MLQTQLYELEPSFFHVKASNLSVFRTFPYGIKFSTDIGSTGTRESIVQFGYSSEMSKKACENSTAKCIIVDDNPNISHIIKEDCIELGITESDIGVFGSDVTASDVYTAIQEGKFNTVKYCILDMFYSSSKLDGIHIYEALKRNNPKVKAIFYAPALKSRLKKHMDIKERFKKLTSEDLENYIVPKNFDSIHERRLKIKEKLGFPESFGEPSGVLRKNLESPD